jgi:hypothetical protein
MNVPGTVSRTRAERLERTLRRSDMDRTRNGEKGDDAEMNCYEKRGRRGAEGAGRQRAKGCWEQAEDIEERADGIEQTAEDNLKV